MGHVDCLFGCGVGCGGICLCAWVLNMDGHVVGCLENIGDHPGC